MGLSDWIILMLIVVAVIQHVKLDNHLTDIERFYGNFSEVYRRLNRLESEIFSDNKKPPSE